MTCRSPRALRRGEPWQDHERYPEALGPVLAREAAHGALVLLGDLNQRTPAQLVPKKLAGMLKEILSDFEIWTGGEVLGLETQLLCHLAGSRQLRASTPPVSLSKHTGGLEVSDPDGVVVPVGVRG